MSCSLCIKEKSTPGNCCFVSCKLRLASHFDQPASRKTTQLSGLAGPCVWLISRSNKLQTLGWAKMSGAKFVVQDTMDLSGMVAAWVVAKEAHS